MAKKIFDQKSIERSILADYYHLCEVFWIPEPLQKDNPDDYWGKLIKAADAFIAKYDGNVFARNLAMALMDTKNQESLEAKEGKE
jgi:hypothetical protein